MPLARTFDPARGAVVTTLHQGYLDRLSRWSDIQEYLPYLHDRASSYPGVRVLELGTRKGNSTLAFLAAAEAAGGHVWSADIDDVTRDPEGMMWWRRCPRWTFIRGDDMHPAVRSALPGEVDVLFVDADHRYEHVVRELAAYMPRVAPGGTALFHDTKLRAWPGYEPPGDLPPVRQALDEWCAQAGMSWTEIPGEYGLGEIRR